MALLSVLTIRCRDEASAVVSKLSQSLRGLNGRGMEGAENGVRSLVGQITQGVLQANLLTGAFTSVVGAVQRAGAAVQGALGESMQLQLSNMTTASSVAAMTGQSFDQASGFVDRLNSRLAIAAASLPGATAEYTTLGRAIFDNVVPAFKNAAGVVDTKALEEGLFSITQAYGVLSAGAGLNAQQTAFGLSRALGGSSIAELKQFEFFQELPQISNYIEETLKGMGKELKDLDPAQRLKLLQDAADKFATPEFRRRAAESADGLIQGFKSGFLDPVSGLFGISRDVDLDTAGVQSVFSRFNESLKILIGSDGIFAIASSLLSKLGLTADPMLILDRGLAKVNTLLNGFKGFLGNLQAVANAGGDLSDLLRLIPVYLNFKGLPGQFTKLVNIVTGTIASSMGGAGKKLAGLLNQGVGIIGGIASSIDTAELGMAIGGILGVAFNELVNFASTIDYGQIIAVAVPLLGKAFVGLLSGLGGALMQTDTRSLITVALTGVGAAIAPLLLSAAGGLATAFVGWLTSSAGIAAIAAIAPPIVSGLLTLAGGIATALAGLSLAVVAPLVIALIATFALLAKVIHDHKEQIMVMVQQFFAPIGAYFAGVGELFRGLMSGNINQAVSGAKQMLDAIVGYIRNIYDTVAAAIPGLPTSGQISAGQAATQAEARFNAAGGATATVAGWSQQNVRNYASGYIPAAAGGLMAAAAREARSMPQGAEVTIANSSEAIIPARNLRSASAATGGKTINLGGIHIHGISDPAGIADAVIREIQARFEAAGEAQLV